ncbi:MAG: hypothetical protein ABI353_00150 [Isosphaeraceae bacterium]
MEPVGKQTFVGRLESLLDQPIGLASRIVLVVVTGLMVLSFFYPLWQYGMEAPQYPKGLTVNIYYHHLEGGHGGHDLNEINELNHYIGMRKIERSQFTELDWIPFAFGILMLLALRAALIGIGRSLIDLSVLIMYLSLFTLSRFIYWLHSFGHDLDPRAAIQIKPFMPVIVGSKQVANFMTHSYPRLGSLFVALFTLGIVGVTFWHFWTGFRASRAPRPSKSSTGVETPSSA